MDKLGVNDLKEQKHLNRTWKIILEAGALPEDLERPGFWANVGVKLTRHDEIVFWTNDGLTYGKAVVRACSRLEAVVTIISQTSFGERVALSAVNSDYAVDFSGEKSMWCVYRMKPSDKDPKVRVKAGGPTKTGFQTQQAAELWMRDHVKAMAA